MHIKIADYQNAGCLRSEKQLEAFYELEVFISSQINKRLKIKRSIFSHCQHF